MYIARKGLATEQVEDDLLVLDQENEKIHQLNATARVVWECIQEGYETEQIIDEITQSFEVSKETAGSDVQAILQNFLDLNLVEKQQSATVG